LTVELSEPANQTVSVDYETKNDGTAYTNVRIPDFSLNSGTLLFAPGETTKTINIPIVGDDTFELDEYFSVTLSNLIGNAALGASSKGTVTIINDDPVPVLFQSANAPVTEGNLDSTGKPVITQVSLPVSLSIFPPIYHPAEAVTVNYTTQDGTATATGTANNPADYQATSGTLTFLPGEFTKTIDVSIIGDNFAELDETFSIILTGVSSNGILGSPSSATVTITNDDGSIIA
jgi:hypothetical protein